MDDIIFIIFCISFVGGFINAFPLWLIVGRHFDNVLKNNNIPLPQTFNFYWSQMNRSINYGALLSRYYLLGKTYKKSKYYNSLFKGFDIYKYARKRDIIISSLEFIFATCFILTLIIGAIINY